MANLLIIAIVISAISVFNGIYADLDKCVQVNPCLCTFNENSKIDISRVLGNKNYLTDSESNTTYYFSGCHEAVYENNRFSLLRQDVYYISTSNITNIIYKFTLLGNITDISFEFDEGSKKDFRILYNTENHTASVRLLCDEYAIPFIKIIDITKNQLVLSSPEVCIITEHHGLSGGSIFLLLLFITALMYFVGGGLILYFIRGARGVEVIPNTEFWRNLPGLIKDGVIFLLSGCRPTLVSTAETYDRI